MQVDTNVGEADVGRLTAGMPATFTVDAYPGRPFTGRLRQIRNAAQTIQNVVTYDAVVAVHDTSGRLFPGMTAQVSIDTGTAQHVLTVPIAAVLYRPAFPRAAAGGGSPGVLVQGGTAQGGVSAPVAGAPGSTVTVWVLRNGRPAPVRIIIGASDAQNIQVRSGLEVGTPVIISQRTGGQGGGRRAGGPNGGGPGPAGGGRGAPGGTAR